MRYNDFTILNEEPKKLNQRRVRVQCMCGAIKTVYYHHLKAGKTKSCNNHIQLADGSFQQKFKPEKQKEYHHSTHTATYRSYSSMISRCYDRNNPDYKDYGGRGITVAKEWLDSYEQFVQDNGDRPQLTSIDRIDVNGNYEPGNTRWATDKVQNNNKRSSNLALLHKIFGQKN